MKTAFNKESKEELWINVKAQVYQNIKMTI